MKFGRLIEYNLKNSFLEKSFTKCGGETIPRPFFKNSKLSICPDQISKVLYILFLLFGKLRVIEIDWYPKRIYLKYRSFNIQKKV